VASRITLDDAGDEKNLIRIRNSQIRGILNQDPVTNTIDRRKPLWFGAPNYEAWQQEALASMGK
jgi:hypothetical protein